MAGIGTRLLKITVDAVERNVECSVAEVTTGETEADFETFADAAAGGGRDYKLHIVAVQDAAAATLWSLVFEESGTSVPCILKPYGNAAASVAQPHFTFNAVVTEPDGALLGGEADKSTTARMTFEAEWPLEAKPVKVTV
jgi:hypothetical protein